MLRNFRRILGLILMLAMLLPMGAYADLMRGSKGEAVEDLQGMLFDMGYLYEMPDGQFGGKTEAAVKEYQRATGLEETGVVTDELMEQISQDWIEYWDWVNEQLRLDAAGEYAPFCYAWEDENGHMVTEFCQKHALLWDATQETLAYGDAESAEYSFYEWQGEIISLYDEWISLAGEPAREQVEKSKALCTELIALQRSAMFDSYDAAGTEIEPVDVYYGAELWMRTHAAWLCQMLSTLRAQ